MELQQVVCDVNGIIDLLLSYMQALDVDSVGEILTEIERLKEEIERLKENL